MYTQTLAKERIFDSEKMVFIIVLMLLTTAVFSTVSLPLNAYDSGEMLKGYVQEKAMYEKSSNNALFLLEKEWKKELEKKYRGNKVINITTGVAYIPMYVNIGNRRVKVNVTEINRKINPDLEILPQTASDRMHSKSKIVGIAVKNKAIIAVNGSYFKQDTGTPLGALVIDKEIISGPIYERAGFGISDNDYKTARIKFQGEIKSGNKSVKIDNINQPRTSAKHVLIYTSKWGVQAPGVSKPAVYISVEKNKITKKSDKPLNINSGNIVISAPNGMFKDFNTGDIVDISYNLNPEWKDVKHIISGGPYLVKNNQVFVDTESERLTAISGRNPRTAIGYTLDNVLVMVTVDGRKEGSSGVTLNELAFLMKKLGCCEAINLDGGSSTAMYVRGKVLTGSNIKGSASVNNVLLVRKKFS